VDEFQGEELAGTDEAPVVFIDEIEGQESEKVGENEVDGEVRVCVADKVKPVEGRGWRFFARGAVERGPVVVVVFSFSFTHADVVLESVRRCNS